MRFAATLLAILLPCGLAFAEAGQVVEAAARRTVLPKRPPVKSNRSLRTVCEIEIGRSVTKRYLTTPVVTPSPRDPNAMLITCDDAKDVHEAGKEMTLACTNCKITLADGSGDAPQAIVDLENNRVTLLGSDDKPARLTFEGAGPRRTVSAVRMELSIDESGRGVAAK